SQHNHTVEFNTPLRQLHKSNKIHLKTSKQANQIQTVHLYQLLIKKKNKRHSGRKAWGLKYKILF
ncbi:hypothetical protein, partial [Pseudomonas sp. AH2 (2023)]|uniref:hypothetical protein n=1 Tax=Pseudomonas sp. AH2 (2023) TaxID=3048599 RepID=UPI002B2360C4